MSVICEFELQSADLPLCAVAADLDTRLTVDNVVSGTTGEPALVFTVEYSVRSAMTAVYEMLDLDREVPPVTKHYRKPSVLADAVRASYR